MMEHGHNAEPPRIGHRWFDAGITIAILLVSVSSLIVAIVHSQTLEKMADANARLVEANSWPYLSYNTGKGSQVISMSVMNDGVGPAKIQTIQVKWQGRAVRDALGFLESCCGFRPGTVSPEYELIPGRVVRAGQSLDILTLPRTNADDSAWTILSKARLSPRLEVLVCYCSVFDQCWTDDIVRFSLKPRPVERCPVPAVPFGIPE